MAESEARAPIAIPTYSLGDEGKPDHFIASTSRDDAAVEAHALAVGDAGFIKRSDLKWTYAIVTERMENEGSVILRFEVDKDKNRKSFPQAQWGKYIRVIKIDEAELAKLQAEVDAAKPVEEEAPKEEEESPAVEEEGTEVESKAESTKSSGSKGSWFGIFGSSKKAEKKAEETRIVEAVPESTEAAEDKKAEDAAPAAAAEEETPAPAETPAVEEKDAAPAEAPVEKAPSKEEAAPAAPAQIEAEPDNTKENSDPDVIKLTQPQTFFPTPKAEDSKPQTFFPTSKAEDSKKEANEDSVSALRSPLNLKTTLSLKKKNSIVKLFGKSKSTPKADEKKTITLPPTKTTYAALGGVASPKAAEKKEWFDPDACEVDYDKNPTDLFQALEARQFSYADEMYKQVNGQFTKQCKTWVVARGQKKKDSAQLRFRALPLHAALVFGAPDDMVIKILNAYPSATRGRDVKGRLPTHLAMEHNASEEVMSAIIEAFPKGFFAKDKKDMTPLDYVNLNMTRSHMKKYLPLLTAAKVEDERVKWESELENALAAQKNALKRDPEYMEDVIATITDDIETTYASKMGLLEQNYQKEIQLLKKKHDSETQALLEGFEVKLNFERKLQKLKGTAKA